MLKTLFRNIRQQVLNKYIGKRVFMILFLCNAVLMMLAQPVGFPIPPVTASQLFFLQRTPNTNTIICDVNLKDGKLYEDEPVHVYWIRYTEKSQKAELNFIQRKFAYGIKSSKIGDDAYEIYFVSYKKFKMYLMQGTDKKYHAFAVINNKQAILHKIYIHINGGTFWSPNVEYVDVTGTDPSTGQIVTERRKV